MRLTSSNQRQFMRESGLRVRAYEQGYSTSVAAIFAADWALEYPHPVSPKVHVSLLYITHNPDHICFYLIVWLVRYVVSSTSVLASCFFV